MSQSSRTDSGDDATTQGAGVQRKKKGKRGGKAEFKPPKHGSYETMGLTSTKKNPIIRPCGFRTDGSVRKIKDTCLISRMRTLGMRKGVQPKIAVCITMYNEEEKELKDTLSGVLQNYNAMYMDDDLELRQQEMVVCIVCDGYDAIKQSFKDYCRKYKLFDDRILQKRGFMRQERKGDEYVGKWSMKTMRELMEDNVSDENVPKNCLHLFQVCTWDFGLDRDYLGGRRINFIFALKQRNDGKINSHKWFFQGICKYLKPEYALMLDVGTKANDNAILKLYKYMWLHPLCGGCCGEIEVDLWDPNQSFETYLVRAAQFYEYKLSHSPDKAMESFFGFNSVLPGAYCLFRWNAIQKGPMDAFFKLANSTRPPTCAEANEYLAEDRVMCLQIYIKEDCGFYLTYIPDAIAVTDAPGDIMTLIKQRRRWQNGALFAAWRVLFNNLRMMGWAGRSQHPCYRQVGMVLFMMFYLTNQIFTLVIVGSFYVSIKMFFTQYGSSVSAQFGAPKSIQLFFEDGGFETSFSFLYLALVVWAVIVSLAGPLDRAMSYFKYISAVFSFLTIASIIGIGTFLSGNSLFPNEQKYIKYDGAPGHWWTMDATHFQVLTLCGYVMISVFFLPFIFRPIDALKNLQGYVIGMITYILLLPTFINIMQIYAMCNLHDISWGNRPSAAAGATGTNAFSESAKKQAALKKDYEMFRVNFFIFWVVINSAYILFLGGQVGSTSPTINDGTIGFLEGFSMYLAGVIVYKVFFAALHLIRFRFRLYAYSDMKIQNLDEKKMKKEYKKLRGDIDQDRSINGKGLDAKSHLTQEQTMLMQEEEDDEEDEDILATSILPDPAKGGTKKKGRGADNDLMKSYKSKLKDNNKLDASQKSHRSHRTAITTRTARNFDAVSALDKTQYEDDDDDDEEFDDADEEEQEDMDFENQIMMNDFAGNVRAKDNNMLRSHMTDRDELDDATSEQSHMSYRSKHSLSRFKANRASGNVNQIRKSNPDSGLGQSDSEFVRQSNGSQKPKTDSNQPAPYDNSDKFHNPFRDQNTYPQQEDAPMFGGAQK